MFAVAEMKLNTLWSQNNALSKYNRLLWTMLWKRGRKKKIENTVLDTNVVDNVHVNKTKCRLIKAPLELHHWPGSVQWGARGCWCHWSVGWKDQVLRQKTAEIKLLSTLWWFSFSIYTASGMKSDPITAESQKEKNTKIIWSCKEVHVK